MDIPEEKVKELLEARLCGYLLHKSGVEFFLSKKPSKMKDRVARMTGQHGYGYRLGEWYDASSVDRYWHAYNKGACFTLAQLLGEEELWAGWDPEEYIEKHKGEFKHPAMLEAIKQRKLGPEGHLRAARVMIDIPPS